MLLPAPSRVNLLLSGQEILRAQRELVRRQVEEHSSHEVKTLGDGFMVAFASARRAVACAVGIQRALAEHNRRQPPDEQVRVRIGLNTGEVIQEEADLFGEAVNAASRIRAKIRRLAPGGTGGENRLVTDQCCALRLH